jgi:phosphoribosylformylglycinamidine cyclo-ligase
MAHITGSGIPGNLPRVLPPHVHAVLWRERWDVPPILKLIQEAGKVPEREMFRVFNMGIGLAVVVSKHFCESVLARFEAMRIPAAHLGEVVKGKGEVVFRRKAPTSPRTPRRPAPS